MISQVSKGFPVVGGESFSSQRPYRKVPVCSGCIGQMDRQTEKVMAVVDEMEPLRREQLFSRTAARQISESMTGGTSEARVHGRWYVL